MSAGKFVVILFLIILLGIMIFGTIIFIKDVVLPELSQKAKNIGGEIGENIRCQIKCSVISALGKECNC